MKKPLDIKALDVFLSAVEDRLTHLESKMGMYKDEDEREPVSEDTIEKKRVCPECGMPEGDCKCGYFGTEAKAAMVLGAALKEGATINLDGKRTTLLRFGYTQFGTDGSPMWEVEADIDGKAGTVEIHSERSYEVIKGSGAEHVHAKTYIVDAETKVRYVRDAAYWGVPVMTPIAPGMKPQGPTSPAGRARRSSMTGRNIRRSMPSTNVGGDKTPGRAAPRKRVKPKKGSSDNGEEGGGAGKWKSKPSVRRQYNEGVRKRQANAESRTRNSGSSSDKPRPDWAPESAERVNARDIRPGDTIHTKPRSDMFASTFEVSSVSDNREPAMDDGPGARGNATSRVSIRGKNKNERMTLGEGEHWVTRGKPSGDKPKKPVRKVRKDKDSFENPDGTPIRKDGDSESSSAFQKDENDRYTAAKAEDFSVDAVAKELGTINRDGSADGSGTLEDPIDVGDDVVLAHKLLSEGKHVRMKDTKSVSTLIDKLREVADDARAKGEKAPEYDLCKVSVPKTNLFCIESKGVPRVNMPQFKGAPHEGSFAETKFNADKGEADVEGEFRELLEKMGIKTEMKTVKASDLKASQENLDGAKVAGMAGAMKAGKIPDAPIFVTRDGYIVDGHHRWAAKVALDLEDGTMGDVEMPVEVIDGDIGFILDVANGFADIAGIKRKGLGAAADGVGGKKPTTGRSGDSVVLDGVGTVVQSDNTQGKKWWDIRDDFSKKTDDDCGCSGNVY